MRIAAWLLLGSQGLVILAFWAWNHIRNPLGNQLTGQVQEQLLAYGRLAGLLAAFGVLLQFILIGRVKWVERVFGLDTLARLHHRVGFGLVLLLVAHPILLNLGHGMQAEAGPWPQFLDFCRNWRGVFAATIGLCLMLGAIAASITILRRRLRYETWYAVHLTFYLAVALAFWHQLAVGSDFTDNRWFAGYWYALYALVFGNFLVYRLVIPVWQSVRQRFTVASLVTENHEVTSVYITGRHLDRFPAAAGQFLIVRFLAPGFRWEAHPFSISSKPDGQRLRLTIKRLGDFTRRIPQLKPGTRVLIDGPHGIFTARRCTRSKVLLIAGGIGITPLRAIAEELLATDHDLVLVYGNRQHDGIVFATELDALAQTAGGRFRVCHVMSNDPAWPGERGTIDRARLARLVPDVVERDVYLCGPPLMMTLVRQDLLALGVSRQHIYWERFAL